MDKSPCTTTGLRHNFGEFASKYNFNASYHLWLQQQYDMASDSPTDLVTLFGQWSSFSHSFFAGRCGVGKLAERAATHSLLKKENPIIVPKQSYRRKAPLVTNNM
jgi:hypothetical protein